MSVHYSSHVWKNEIDVHGTHLLALLAYADMANDDGLSYGSKAHIAYRIRRSENTVRAVTADLEAAHKIIVVSRVRATDYVIVVAKDHNGTYEALCKKYKVEPVELIPLKENSRGKSGFDRDSLLSSEGFRVLDGRVQSSEGSGVQSSEDESLLEPSLRSSSAKSSKPRTKPTPTPVANLSDLEKLVGSLWFGWSSASGSWSPAKVARLATIVDELATCGVTTAEDVQAFNEWYVSTVPMGHDLPHETKLAKWVGDWRKAHSVQESVPTDAQIRACPEWTDLHEAYAAAAKIEEGSLWTILKADPMSMEMYLEFNGGKQ